MALITCPECGREISDKAVSCPGCGFPMNGYAVSESGEQKKANEVIASCSYCGSAQITVDGYCNSCGMKISTHGKTPYVDYNNVEQKIPEVPYTICPMCGYYNLGGIYTCKNCKHKYSLGEYEAILPKVLQEEIAESNQYKCPKCGSERIHAFVHTVQTSKGKTKTRYTMNLNPFHPFTLISKKEKIIANPQYVNIGKMQCDNCGKIFR